MRLLNLVKQHYRVWLTTHRLGELSTLIVTDISRRRSDKSRYGVTLLILTHIYTRHHILIVKEELRQRLCKLRLTHTRSTEEDKRAYRLAWIAQTRTRATHRLRNGDNCTLLTHHTTVQLILHLKELLALRGEHSGNRDARPARYHLGNILGIDLLLYHLARRCGNVKLALQCLNSLLAVDNLTISNLRHTAVITLTFSLLRLNLEGLNLLLVLLNLEKNVSFTLPFGPHLRLLCAEVVNLLVEVLNTHLIALATNSLALNLRLTNTTVEGIYLLGHRVHLKTQLRCSLVDQINRFIRQKTVGDISVR